MQMLSEVVVGRNFVAFVNQRGVHYVALSHVPVTCPPSEIILMTEIITSLMTEKQNLDGLRAVNCRQRSGAITGYAYVLDFV